MSDSERIIELQRQVDELNEKLNAVMETLAKNLEALPSCWRDPRSEYAAERLDVEADET